MFLIVPYLLLIIIPYLIWKYLPTGYYSLRGKNVLITGAGSGIGRQMALQAATRYNANLILLDLRMDAILRVKKEIKEAVSKNASSVRVECHQCDVSRDEQVHELLSTIQKTTQIDVLINNAGIVIAKDIEDMTAHEFRSVFNVNAIAPFLMVKEVLPHMKERRSGYIVNIASVMGHIGCARLSEYCASKHALVGFHESLRVELQRDGFGQKDIGTTLICPSGIDTGMFEGLHLTWLMKLVSPLLKEENVAKRVLQSIERREYVVYMPALTAICFPFARLLPTPLKDVFCQLMGGHSGINNSFKGRGVKFSLGEDVAEKGSGASKGVDENQQTNAQRANGPSKRKSKKL